MAKKSSKSWIVVLVVVIAAGAAAFWWWKKKPAVPPIEYRTASVARGDIVQSVTANGQLSPVVTVQVGSQVSGNITNIHVDFNSKVTNGQLVAELDPATYEARMIQAEGELASAEAQMILARLNSKRAAELLKNKLIAESEHDQTMAELKQREASVKMRVASLKSAQVDLDRTKIYSPIDGTVISRNVDVGQTVQASFTAPTLFNIANDLAKMEIGAMVSEADIGGIEEGQDASFTVEAFPSRTFTGKVIQVRNQPTTNQNVVTYATVLEVENRDLKLKPGMTANVTITTGKKTGVLRLANAALRFRPPEDAFVITNTSAVAEGGTNSSRGGGGPGGAGGPDGGRRGPPSDDQRQQMMARFDKNGDGQLDETERAAMRASFGGGGRPRADGAPQMRTVYLVSTNATAKRVELKQIRVRAGLGDSTSTEILDGLKEGDVVAIGATGGAVTTTAAAPQNNPFGGGGGGFGGGRR